MKRLFAVCLLLLGLPICFVAPLPALAQQAGMTKEQGQEAVAALKVTVEKIGAATDPEVKIPLLKEAIRQTTALGGVLPKAQVGELLAFFHNGLGDAYSARRQEGRAENLEQAVAAYEAAAHHWTKQANPKEWAMNQNDLGTAYAKDTARNNRFILASAVRSNNSTPGGTRRPLSRGSPFLHQKL